jgi:hypothetical protein
VPQVFSEFLISKNLWELQVFDHKSEHLPALTQMCKTFLAVDDGALPGNLQNR